GLPGSGRTHEHDDMASRCRYEPEPRGHSEVVAGALSADAGGGVVVGPGKSGSVVGRSDLPSGALFGVLDLLVLLWSFVDMVGLLAHAVVRDRGTAASRRGSPTESMCRRPEKLSVGASRGT